MIVSPNESRSVLPLVMILAVSLLPLPSLADPPPWAPAHGWRKKNDPYYAGYTGRKWERDYGILDGRCNREAVGAVLGAATGGMIGSPAVWSMYGDRGEGIVVANIDTGRSTTTRRS